MYLDGSVLAGLKIFRDTDDTFEGRSALSPLLFTLLLKNISLVMIDNCTQKIIINHAKVSV